MSEPVYSYVRGVGWALGEPTRVTMQCGTVVSIEMRRPLPGEIWDYGNPRAIEHWKLIIGSLRFEHLQRHDPPYEEDAGYCVITKL